MFICKVLWYAQSKKKTALVQILSVLYLLIAEDGFGAPFLFQNPACSCENIMLNRSNYQWGLVQNSQQRQLREGPFIKTRVRKENKLQVLVKNQVVILYLYVIKLYVTNICYMFMLSMLLVIY